MGADLDPCKAYSTASIAKAYLREMGLRSALEAFDVPDEILGATMSAFYGGRAEARIRKTPVPVVYTDFTSMYPTVQCLMGLWEILTAERVSFPGATGEVRELLGRITLDDCFDPAIWKDFVGFVTWKSSEITADDYIDRVTNAWKSSKPLIRFLCEAIDAPF